jgi:coenzyme F420-0:L-glutamate ligase/coenzyme F420-1:gamma-L-glutamate ligase
MLGRIEVIGFEGFPIVKQGDDLAKIIHTVAQHRNISWMDGDILVVAHKIVSKAEGQVVHQNEVQPSLSSQKIARKSHKPAWIVELALKEARSIVRKVKGHLITETHHGWIYSYSGVDISNVSGGDSAVLLPRNPDDSAKMIREGIKKLSGKNVSTIISDTTGRPFRRGDVDVAIGVSGINPLHDLRGKKDAFGYTLSLKRVATADELASAAELVIGQSDEMTPVALIRGYLYNIDELASSKALQKPKEKDIFLKRISSRYRLQ